MARAHFVKSARKDNPVASKGESYYWWKFRYGPKHYSKNRPRRSQLTQSAFLATVYDIQDSTIELSDTVEGLHTETEDLISQLEDLRDECESSLQEMPEHLQESSTSGEILQERIDALDEAISTLEGIDFEPDGPYNEEEVTGEIKDEIENVLTDLG